jgi:hypothetical protein
VPAFLPKGRLGKNGDKNNDEFFECLTVNGGVLKNNRKIR